MGSPSLPLRVEPGNSGHAADHETIARLIWLVLAAIALLTINVVSLWVLVLS